MPFNFLIVDDSNTVRKVMQKTLSMTTLEIGSVLEAANGAEALAVLKGNWVDLIFLDINMPIMNGIEFMEKLRADPEIRDTKVVIVSTEGSTERRTRLEDLGIRAYLRKPVTPEIVTSTVLDVLGVEKP